MFIVILYTLYIQYYIVFYIYTIAGGGLPPARKYLFEGERKTMLNMNLDAKIDNILYLEYMQAQQEKSNVMQKENQESEKTTTSQK